MTRTPRIDVAVAVVRDARDRVLMAERSPRQIAAGHWELPGGKIEAGETPEQAARRELAEEAGLVGERLRPWIVYDYAFPARSLRLHFFLVERWSGVPEGREGNRLAWVSPARPEVGPVLPSNRRALARLSLPEVLLRCSPEAPVVPGAPGRGSTLAVLRGGSPGQRVQRARRMAEAGVRTLLVGTPLEALRAGALGLASPWPHWAELPGRPPVDLWAVECRAPGDLERAAGLDADLALVPAKSAEEPGFAARLARLSLVVYLEAADFEALARARAAGAAGVLVDVSSEPRTARARLGGERGPA